MGGDPRAQGRSPHAPRPRHRPDRARTGRPLAECEGGRVRRVPGQAVPAHDSSSGYPRHPRRHVKGAAGLAMASAATTPPRALVIDDEADACEMLLIAL